MRRLIPIIAAATALSTPATVLGHAGEEHGPDAEVAAAGNAFTGGLEFEPAAVRVDVGGVVQWENTDFLVPHTATEDNELWDETGTYGATPVNPPGFGPGETRQRAFAAGTWGYFCRVHPVEMTGTVAVPVTLEAKRIRRGKKRGKFKIKARWATERLPDGQAFAVQRRPPGKGGWRWLERQTRDRKGKFITRRGKRWRVRARVRSTENPAIRSGWSPRAQIRAR